MATLADESLDKKQDYDSIMIEKEVDISQLKNAETFQTKLSACFYKKGNISKR